MSNRRERTRVCSIRARDSIHRELFSRGSRRDCRRCDITPRSNCAARAYPAQDVDCGFSASVRRVICRGGAAGGEGDVAEGFGVEGDFFAGRDQRCAEFCAQCVLGASLSGGRGFVADASDTTSASLRLTRAQAALRPGGQWTVSQARCDFSWAPAFRRGALVAIERVITAEKFWVTD